MIKRIGLLIIIGVMVVASGCSNNDNNVIDDQNPDLSNYKSKPPELSITITSTPITSSYKNTDAEFSKDIVFINDDGLPNSIKEGYGIKGTKITIDGMYPGYFAIVPITILNGNDSDKKFIAYIADSNKIENGYEPLPEEYKNWIITPKEASEIVKAGNEYKIPITFSMPDDIRIKDKHYQIDIIVRDWNESDLVQIAGKIKCYINIAKTY